MSRQNIQSKLKIRNPSSAQDWEKVKTICCQTGNAGNPITQESWSTFEKIWIDPYQSHYPEWTWVAEYEDQIIGYLTGCPNSSENLVDFFKTEHRSLNFFSKSTVDSVLQKYPAHLHINFDSAHRGMGGGKALINVFKAELAKNKIPGIHVMCGLEPLPFYKKQHFHEIEQLTLKNGKKIYLLGLTIPSV